uniref:Uncharacterized protein n=1 Tax=Oryza glaberrima TaxID=4538 RepID=I1QXW4_ORYGL
MADQIEFRQTWVANYLTGQIRNHHQYKDADVIAFHILFIGLTRHNTGKVLIEYGGLALQLVAVFVYVMLKVGDKKYVLSEERNKILTHSEAKTHNIGLLSFFMIAVLAAIIQIQFQFPFPENYSTLAKAIGIFGMFFQVKGENGFKNDAPHIRKLKITATLIKIMTLSYELWAQISQGYRQSVLTKPLYDMTIAALIVNCVLFAARYIGPKTIKEYFFPPSPPTETRKEYFTRTLALLHKDDFPSAVQRPMRNMI